MNKSNIGALVLAATLLASLTGCGSIQDKIAEKVTEGIAEKAVGGNVDITKDGVKVQKDGVNYETGNDLKWPKESMGDLPEPKAKISAVMSDGVTKGGSVTFTGMSLVDAKAYAEKLKEMGYTDGISISDMDMVSHSGKNSSGASVMFTYSITPKEGAIMYSPAGAQ